MMTGHFDNDCKRWSSGTGSSSEATYPMEDYTFVGLVGIEDPPKGGVAEAMTAEGLPRHPFKGT